MKPTTTAELIDNNVAISDLAREFGHDLHAFRHWLLRHDFCVDRRHHGIAILTAAEAAKARFLNTYGVVFEAVSG